MVQWLMIPGSRSKFLFLSLLSVGLVVAAAWIGLRAFPKKESSLQPVAETIVVEEAEVARIQPAPEGVPAPAPATGSGVFDKIASEVSGVYERAVPSVVRIRSSDGPEQLAGTGFFVDNQGTILTAYAVVGQAKEVTVETAGRTYSARVLGRDPRSGVALLKVKAGETPFLLFG